MRLNKSAHKGHGPRGWLVASIAIISLVVFIGAYVALENDLNSAPVYSPLKHPEINERLNIAREHLNEKRYPQSERTLREAINSAPANALAHNLLGLTLKKQNRFNDAIASYETAITLRPSNFEARNNLAVALEAVGRMREAEGVYLRALQDAPADPTLHLNLALLLEHEGRISEALEHYFTFVNISRENELIALVRMRIESIK
jgi:Flp pilus assembly protein TadD